MPTRWLAMRFSSHSSTRITSAFSGTRSPHSRSTARLNPRFMFMAAR